MFNKMQEIDRAFRSVRLFALCGVFVCLLVSWYAIHEFSRRADAADALAELRLHARANDVIGGESARVAHLDWAGLG